MRFPLTASLQREELVGCDVRAGVFLSGVAGREKAHSYNWQGVSISMLTYTWL